MSLQGLVSGADCAVASNPLSQVLKHTDGDRSLQQDRVAGPSSSRLHHLPSTLSHAAAEQDMAMARQFFEGGGQTSSPAPSLPLAHYIPRPDMTRMMGHAPAGPNLSDAWAQLQRREGGQSLAKPGPSAVWAGEFQPFPPQIASPSIQHDLSQHALQQSPYASAGQFGNFSPMYRSSMPQTYFQMEPPSVVQGKGKGKLQEADFEAAFAQVAAAFEKPQGEVAHIEEVNELDKVEAAMSQVNLADQPADDLGNWESEFNSIMNGLRDSDFDYGAGMEQAWKESEDLGRVDLLGRDGISFNEEGLPLLDAYAFDSNNKYLDPSVSTGSPLDQAKALLEQGGSLSEAGLLLEAAIQKGELGEGGYETWILLGETRSMDEREEAGMKALIEGVRRAEEAGATGAGMLSLAISYTNEAFDRASHATLLRWLRARFPDYPIPESATDSLSRTSWNSYDSVTETFLGLARWQHGQGIVDADVQAALGILFYSNSEYERAKDCFESALSARPDDYLLWNRLGSCLSNGNKPEESLGAYREALRLRPTYTRVIYNVGVACLNIGAHKEAVEHFLSALSMQEVPGEKSEQLWFTLRRAFLAMDRPDLADMVKTHPNLEVFRFEFDY